MTVTPLQIRKTLADTLAVLPNNIQNQTGSPSACGQVDEAGNIAYFNKLCVGTINGSPVGGASFPLLAPFITIDPTGNTDTSIQPPYGFSGDHWTGLYSNGVGKLGLAVNAFDSTSNQIQSVLQIQPYTVQGWPSNNLGKAIVLPRTVGIGWTQSQTDNQTIDNNVWTFFSQGPAVQWISLACNDQWYGCGYLIWGQYTKESPFSGNDWRLSIDVTQTSSTGVLITTEGRGTSQIIPLSLSPTGRLNLTPGGELNLYNYWVIQSADHAFKPYTNGTVDCGTSALQIRNVFAAGALKTGGKAGVAVDGDVNTPTDGMLRYDSTNNRLYIRIGGTWRYATLT